MRGRVISSKVPTCLSLSTSPYFRLLPSTMSSCKKRVVLAERLSLVVFNHHLLVKRQFEFAACRQREDTPGHLVDIQRQPGRNALLRQEHGPRLEVLQALAALADSDDIAGFGDKRGNIGLAAIDGEVAVIDQLAGLRPRVGEAETIDQVIQTHLQELQQTLASLAGAARCHIIGFAELAL